MILRRSTAAVLLAFAGVALALPAPGGAAPPAKPRKPAAAARLFAPGSIWNAPLPAAVRLDPRSPLLVAELRRQVRRTAAWINTTRYSTPLAVAGPGAPRVRVTLDHPDRALAAAFAAVPVPAGARPGGGTDQHMTVWQPSTDELWEFWRMHREADGWHARWGGHKTGVSADDGIFRAGYGASGSGLALAAGMIRPDEVRRGRIDHALAITVPNTLAGAFRAPATRTDATGTGIPMGTRLRLDPAVDVRALHLPWIAGVMADAAQRHGIVVRNTGDSVAFYAEDPGAGVPNPWPALLEGRSPSQALSAFPWDRLQVVAPSAA